MTKPFVIAQSKRGHKTEAAAERAMNRAFFEHRDADTGDVWLAADGLWHWEVTDTKGAD